MQEMQAYSIKVENGKMILY